MKDMESLLNDLGATARREVPPDIDVRDKVLMTLSTRRDVVRLDVVPLVFSGFAVTAAAVLVFLCFPSWQTMSDPWASYFIQAGQ